MFGVLNWFDCIGPLMVLAAIIAIYAAVKWS